MSLSLSYYETPGVSPMGTSVGGPHTFGHLYNTLQDSEPLNACQQCLLRAGHDHEMSFNCFQASFDNEAPCNNMNIPINFKSSVHYHNNNSISSSTRLAVPSWLDKKY